MEEIKRLLAISDKLLEDLRAWAIVAHAVTVAYDKGEDNVRTLESIKEDQGFASSLQANQ